MKKIKNTKIISALLSCIIVVSSLSSAVFADESVMLDDGDRDGIVQEIPGSAGDDDSDSLAGSDTIGTTVDSEQDSLVPSDEDSSQDVISDEGSDEELLPEEEDSGSLLFNDEADLDLDSAIELKEDEELLTEEEELITEEQEEVLDGQEPLFVKHFTPDHIDADDMEVLRASNSLVSSSTGPYRYSFTGMDKTTYQKLRSQISDVANGSITDAVLKVSFSDLGLKNKKWTAKELGVNSIISNGEITDAAVNAVKRKTNCNVGVILGVLLCDCPYDLYWYDKTAGLNYGSDGVGAVYEDGEYKIYLTGNYFYYYFSVSSDYSSTNGISYSTSPSKVKVAKSAAAKAQNIVAKYASLSDLDKLTKYKEEICNLVDYDDSSAVNLGIRDYGDPWQLVYVFDGNSSTKVVCEGYAKAFKYLCDLSDFSSDDLTCILVNGDFGDSRSSEGHMWNIVSLDGNANYLVDVTNCDTDSIGYSDLLFMRNATTANSADSYSFNCNGTTVTYVYSADMRSDIYTSSALAITTTALVKSPEIAMKRTAAGIQISWTAVPGATKYTLFRKTQKGDWKAVQTTTAKTFTDPIPKSDPTPYIYCVRALDKTGAYMNPMEEAANSDDVNPVTITTQPKNYTGPVGTTAKFKVVAEGTGLKYQWQVYTDNAWKNTSFVGAATSKLSVDVTKSRNGYTFRCLITDSSGIAKLTDEVTLNVSPSVSIKTQPSNYTGAVGNTATFKVVATGTGLKYQWQTYSSGAWKNSSLPGSTTNTLSVDITKSRDGYKFRCVVTDAGNKSATSNSATLKVATPLSLKTQPKSFIGASGTDATFTVVAKGTGLKYQWQVNTSGSWSNTSFSGARTATLTVPITKSRDGYKFRCVITDYSGKSVTSNAVTLTMAVPLAIKTQPVSYKGLTGNTAKFKVVAQGTGLKYQWQTYSNGKWANSSLTGAKTATLSVPVTNSRNGYKFRCVITDYSGKTVTTNTVTLKVIS